MSTINYYYCCYYYHYLHHVWSLCLYVCGFFFNSCWLRNWPLDHWVSNISNYLFHLLLISTIGKTDMPERGLRDAPEQTQHSYTDCSSEAEGGPAANNFKTSRRIKWSTTHVFTEPRTDRHKLVSPRLLFWRLLTRIPATPILSSSSSFRPKRNNGVH